MANKLTSLTGFGEGDPKPEKMDGAYKITGGVLRTRLNQVDKPHKTSKGYLDAMRSPAKSKALSKKSGIADGINAERKRQGYKPMDAKRKRIHEGMDKYLP